MVITIVDWRIIQRRYNFIRDIAEFNLFIGIHQVLMMIIMIFCHWFMLILSDLLL